MRVVSDNIVMQDGKVRLQCISDTLKRHSVCDIQLWVLSPLEATPHVKAGVV